MKVSLNEISTSIDYGVTASAVSSPVGPKFLRITDIQNGIVEWKTVPWCECSDKELKASTIQIGDIVFARTGATTGKSFLIKNCPDNAVFASYLIRVRLNEKALPDYVSHFFQTPDYWGQISKNSRGAAQPGVNSTSLKTLQIPLPPLPEQKRIAAILDAADATRAKRRESLRQLDLLLQSTFLDMFGDPTRNPKGWDVKPLGHGVNSFEGGKNLMPTEDERADGIRVLKVSAVTSGEYCPEESKSFSNDEAVPPHQIVRTGDLLISRANTAALVGAVCYVWKTNSLEMLPDKIWRFVWNKDKRIDPLFMLHMARSAYFREQLIQRATGTSGSMKNIGKSKMLEIPIPLPPLDLQHRFATIVEAVEKQKDRLRAHLAELDTLFASLQHRAFNGEL